MQGEIQKFLKEGAQKLLKWLLNAHFSCFLINLLQIFHQKPEGVGVGRPRAPGPSLKSAIGVDSMGGGSTC